MPITQVVDATVNEEKRFFELLKKSLSGVNKDINLIYDDPRKSSYDGKLQLSRLEYLVEYEYSQSVFISKNPFDEKEKFPFGFTFPNRKCNWFYDCCLIREFNNGYFYCIDRHYFTKYSKSKNELLDLYNDDDRIRRIMNDINVLLFKDINEKYCLVTNSVDEIAKFLSIRLRDYINEPIF